MVGDSRFARRAERGHRVQVGPSPSRRLLRLQDLDRVHAPGSPRRTPARRHAHAQKNQRQLLDRLARFVPPPRRHRHRYHGVLAPLLCPTCGGEMRIIAFVTHPAAIRDILIHLGRPHRPPPVASARAPPQTTLGLDQTPAFDPAEPEPVPEFVFDPSLPEEFGG